MSRQRRSQSDISHPGHRTSYGFPPEQWDLLTHLPAQVVLAAVSVRPDAGRDTASPDSAVEENVLAGLAGIEAIAGGRAFDSDLVRAVVATIFSEPDEDGSGPPGAAPVHRKWGIRRLVGRARRAPDVLASCRSATAALAARADPADSAAYRQWVQSIAARVCEAACSLDAAGIGCARDARGFTATGRRLLRDLGSALSLT